MNKKVLLDTDIGDDIDDAFALAMLSRLEGAETVGITTVFRNTADRAQQVQKLLEIFGKDIPVYAGEKLPYKEEIHPFASDTQEKPETQHICQWDKDYEKYPVKEGAVDFIIECAKKYGKDLTIIPIGPLTNIARAIEKAPEIMKGIGKIVQMGGWFTNYAPEWNILCDPEAADIVWSSGIDVYAVGLDVTLQCALDATLLDDFRKSELPHNKQLVEWLDKWFAYFHFEKSVMHDPLAVASYFEDVCVFEKKYVKADLTEKRGAALCSDVEKEGYSPIYTATSVDKEKFYAMVRKTLL